MSLIEVMHPDDEGWSEWIHPLPGYLMSCCDCGLVHEMQAAISDAQDIYTPVNDGEDMTNVVVFRMRRVDKNDHLGLVSKMFGKHCVRLNVPGSERGWQRIEVAFSDGSETAVRALGIDAAWTELRARAIEARRAGTTKIGPVGDESASA